MDQLTLSESISVSELFDCCKNRSNLADVCSGPKIILPNFQILNKNIIKIFTGTIVSIRQ